MELGNMIFGNSRGEVSIPRNKSFEGPWQELCDALKLNWYGYADEGCLIPEAGGILQTEVFAVRSYDWDAECDCGADEKMNAWHESHQHAEHCYDTACAREMAAYDARTNFKILEAATFGRDDSPMRGFNQQVEQTEPGITFMMFEPRSDAAMQAWREASEVRDKFEDKLRKRECAARGLSYPSGCAVHCDCGLDEAGHKFWIEIGGHQPTCRYVQPNFLYKPTGFCINWYKYPFRDSYMSPGVSAKEWRKIIRHCIESCALTGTVG